MSQGSSSGASTPSSSSPAPAKPARSTSQVISDAAKRALGGGAAGAIAMVGQVTTLMWLRTMMNYQYRYGSTTSQAFKALYKEGGVLRFYRGYWAAIAQGPLSRFGDTAANAGALALLDGFEQTRDLNIGVKTAFASFSSATFRVLLMPIDAVKTSMQVGGSMQPLLTKMRANGPFVLWHGALATAAGNAAGHWPWFANTLNEKLPKPNNLTEKLLRSAGIGFCASAVSDTVSNSIRVIKTVRQTYETPISYSKAISLVVEKDGVIGLFGRGLKTRIITNGCQGLMFSVLWRLIEDEIHKYQKK